MEERGGPQQLYIQVVHSFSGPVLRVFSPGALVLTMRPAPLLRELWIMKGGTDAENHQMCAGGWQMED